MQQYTAQFYRTISIYLNDTLTVDCLGYLCKIHWSKLVNYTRGDAALQLLLIIFVYLGSGGLCLLSLCINQYFINIFRQSGQCRCFCIRVSLKLVVKSNIIKQNTIKSNVAYYMCERLSTGIAIGMIQSTTRLGQYQITFEKFKLVRCLIEHSRIFTNTQTKVCFFPYERSMFHGYCINRTFNFIRCSGCMFQLQPFPIA